MVTTIPTIWSTKAENDLKAIYHFYSESNINFAEKIINLIISSTESILFEKQYQIDEFLGHPYRRFFIKHWRVIYRSKNNTIIIIRIFDTRKNPTTLS